MDVRQALPTLRATWAPSRTRRLARRRSVRSGALILLGLTVSLVLSSRLAAIEHERARWGDLTSVMVVTEPVAAGERISGRVAMREVPLAMAPPDAVVRDPDAVVSEIVEPQSRALVDLFPGEVLLKERITTSSSTVPPGYAAIALSITESISLANKGDLVDLWMVDGANLSSRRIAPSLVVLELTDRSVTVAVPEHLVADVAAASLRPITLTLVG